MAETSSIEWTDATWNPITGCSVVSPGCTNCYAMTLAGTRLAQHPSRKGLTVPSKAGPVWNGKVRFNRDWLHQPLHWRRPRMIFVCAHGDLFHENVPDEWIDQVFAVMALAPQHTFQALTKRAARMRAYVNAARGRNAFKTRNWPLPNVWLGVSAEDQRRADERIPDLLATPAAVRFVSAEPLLGPIDFAPLVREATISGSIAGVGGDGTLPIGWIIIGGESGAGARPMESAWAQDIVDQCKSAGVAAFVKQLSSGGPKAIKDIDLFPAGLRVREMPRTAP
jgi:protein gp37